MGFQPDQPLSQLVGLWLDKIERSKDFKKEVFQRDADEAQSFYRPVDGTMNFVYRGDLNATAGIGLDVHEPAFKMTLCKVFEVVSIFGPLLYSQNPNRQVNPRSAVEIPPQAIPDPNLFVLTQQQEMRRTLLDILKSLLLEAYLNWTPDKLGLAKESEKAINEGLIKGRGVLWTAAITPPGSKVRLIGSFYDSVDFLYIDHDAESLEAAYWIARKVCEPVWKVERRFGLKAGSLKGAYESNNYQAEVDRGDRRLDRQRGMTNDLLTYYEVYSRMGCGGRLSGSGLSRGESELLPGDLDHFSEQLDPITGDYVYLALAKGVPYPLNLPPELQSLPLLGDGSPGDGVTLIKERLAWPIPYWADPLHGVGTVWPCSVLDFHPVPRSAWPQSHIKPALGELRFLCWAYSFMAGKIKNTLRDVVAILKEMSEQFKLTVLEGADLAMVELDTNNRNIQECVQILQFPPMNADILRIVERVEANFDKRVGLNEVFYGKTDRQDRSATESDIKSQTMNIRPDDMSKKVEAWMTEVARKEAVAARMLLTPQDVLPVLGVTAAAMWQLHVHSTDLAVFHELEYRVEAGSTKKPNRDRDMANADSGMQILLPIFNQFAQGTGQLGPINALLAYWCKTRDIPPGPFQLPVPPAMPSAPAGEGGGGSPPGANGSAPNGKPRETASSGAGGPHHAPAGTS